MSSEDFLIRLSVVFKKFGLILNEFLPIVDCLFHIGIINLSLEFYISHFGNKAINGFCNSVRFIEALSVSIFLSIVFSKEPKSISEILLLPIGIVSMLLVEHSVICHILASCEVCTDD